MTKADDYNAKQITSGAFTIGYITELVRFWQTGHHPLEVDGMAGSETLASVAGVTHPAPFLGPPLPTLPDGRRPDITSRFKTHEPNRPNHDGCDWFYAWKPGDKPDFVGDHGAAGKPGGPPTWGVPVGTTAVAAAAGVVQLASNTPTGIRVWIDHGNGWRTGYFHLTDMRVHVGDRVAAGTPVGTVGDNPADDDARHLHFELSPVDRYEPTDPELFLL